MGSLLESATFSPVRLYFSLFYAEIEYYRKHCVKCRWMADNGLVSFLKAGETEIRLSGETPRYVRASPSGNGGSGRGNSFGNTCKTGFRRSTWRLTRDWNEYAGQYVNI